MNTLNRGLTTALIALALGAALAWASNVTLSHSFSSGTPAVANEVNENFSALAAGVNDNDSRTAALEKALATLQTDLTTANTAITALQTDLTTANTAITALQSNTVLALDGILTLSVVNDYDTALFSGVNVQVVNGVDQTTLNGLGNLIVGYNAPKDGGLPVCSYGLYADQTACEGAGSIWALDHKSGSHNVVAGGNNSYASYGGVVFGTQNAINRAFAGVSGGIYNTASGENSSVSGGADNTASADGYASSVSGGASNKASGTYSSVSGGYGNIASGAYSSVLGGYTQSTSTDYETIPELP